MVTKRVAGVLIAVVLAWTSSRQPAAHAQERFANGCQTTLNNGATVTGGDTSFVVTDGACFPSSGNFRIIIGSEIILVGARSGNTFSALTRHAEGSSAASHADGAAVTHIITAGAIYAIAPYSIAGGRITTETSVPVSSSDRTAQSTLYWTPYNGAQIGLYDGTNWIIYACPEVSLALSGLTTATNYDVFLYGSGTSCVLELSAAWTTDTSRSSAIALQDGVDVKSSAHTRRLVGTIRTTGTTTTEDSCAKRFVWNRNNPVLRSCTTRDPTSSWTQTVDGAWHPMNSGSAVWKFEWVQGVSTQIAVMTTIVNGQAGINGGWLVGIGFDSTTTPSDIITQNNLVGVSPTTLMKRPAALGYHYTNVLQQALVATATFLSNGTNSWSGILTDIWN